MNYVKREMEDYRVADYFVVIGLAEDMQPLEEVSSESAIKPSFRQEPIIDIAVINRSAGEKVPKDFQCLECTPSGFPANLNHGSIRCPDLFICFKRGRSKPPLKDIGILYEGRERVMEGCKVVHTTPSGRPANINNSSSSSRIYITFRRAAEMTITADALVVTDLCVILANKDEEPPLTFNQIPKNLNKGMVGSDVFLCYKKAVVKTDVLVFKPAVLSRYPEEDYDYFPLPESVPMFCLPMGASVGCLSDSSLPLMPAFSTFILTQAGGEKVYGASISFYERHSEERLTDCQMRTLGLKNRTIREQYNIRKTVYAAKALCLLSHRPFFDAFKKFLLHVYKISTTGPHTVPLERHISHFMYNVPYPSLKRPHVMVQLGQDSLSLSMPVDSPFPHSGASFITLLRNLGPDLCINLTLYILLENKILLHSLRPTVLTEVAEAVTSVIFPFHWQCPYIPLCPLDLSDVLNAPCPFIVGIDSRYFDLYDPPPDIICVDLDTSRIWMPDDKKQLHHRLMPRKAVRILQESLHRLFAISTSLCNADISEDTSMETMNVDLDFKNKKKQMRMELLIQEAFLRFTAMLMRDYRSYLNPIMKQPSMYATDASCLFDMQGFLKSRDKANVKFYAQMMKTQMFFRFIEERSFLLDKNACLTFFDECTENVDETKEDVCLIEIDQSQTSERTVFIMPPEPTGLPDGVMYSYTSFPQLKPELFLKKNDSAMPVIEKHSFCPNSPIIHRSKQEVKTALKLARQHINNPKQWAKCLLTHCYSLWFVNFPAYVHTHLKKLEALKVGFAVLQKMHAAKLPFVDQICYRVVMQLAGQYNKPGLAVQVFSLMKRYGIQPDATTYANYNRVMLEAVWPSPKSRGKRRWIKLRNVVMGAAKIRRSAGRISRSVYSNSGSDCDRSSHISIDSYLEDHVDKGRVSMAGSALRKLMYMPTTTVVLADELSADIGGLAMGVHTASLDDRTSTGGVSDGGYNSMTLDDVQKLSQFSSIEHNCLTSLSSSPPTSDHEPLDLKSKFLSQDAMSFTVTSRDLSFCDLKGRHIEKPNIADDPTESLFGCTTSIDCGDVCLGVERLGCGNRGGSDDSCLGDATACTGLSSSKCLQVTFDAEGSCGAAAFSDCDANQLGIKVEGMLLSLLNCSTEREQTATDQRDPPNNRPGLVIAVEDDEDHPLKVIMPSGAGGGVVRCDDEVCDDVSLSRTTQLHPSGIVHSLDGKESEDALSVQSASEVLSVASTGELSSSADDGNYVDSVDKQAGCDRLGHIVSVLDNRLVLSHNDRIGPGTSQAVIVVPTIVSTSSTSPALMSVDDRSVPVRKQTSLPTNSDLSAQVEQRNSSMPMLHSSGTIGQSQCQKQRGSDVAQITNDAITGFWRLASKAASISYSKFNELKQSMTGPLKNARSLSSLTRSQDDLDMELRLNDDSEWVGGDLTIHAQCSERQNSCSEVITDESCCSSGYARQDSELSLGNFPTSLLLPDGVQPGSELCFDSSTSHSAEASKGIVEVEVSSCSRCVRCRCLVFDEEIMSGWSADDSNLNTACTFCRAKFVPNLHVYIKDWRARQRHLPFSAGSTPETCVSSSVPTSEQAGYVEHSQCVDEEKGEFDICQHRRETSGDGPSPMDMPDLPLTLQEAAVAVRRRCHSECLTTVSNDDCCHGYYNSYSPPCFGVSRPSPLHLPSKDDVDLSVDQQVDAHTCMKTDFMARHWCMEERQVFPYLSPLVLRKELECVLDNEACLSLAYPAFLDQHSILFWNLVWYFQRLGLPSHLSSLIPAALNYSSSECHLESHGIPFYNCNVLIRSMWDNVHIHDETGLPMYIAWAAGHRSSVVDALVTEAESFSRPCMHQIISSIQRNDVTSAIRLVSQGRRRLGPKRRFLSLYREILFLSLVSCGRENIDQDAFDREFAIAFEENLSAAEKRRLQLDDRPRSQGVVWCRRAFSDLDI